MTVTANPHGVIVLGRVGENGYRQISFPISEYMADYPNATFALLNQRPGDGTAYPVSCTELSGDSLNWTVIQSDVSVQGQGKCELEVIDNGTIAKSIIYLTRVLPALGSSGDAPDPWISWQAQFQEMKEDAESAARTAAEASSQAIQSAQAASESAQQASTAASSAQAASETAVQAANTARSAAETATGASTSAQSSAQAAANAQSAAEAAKSAAQAANQAAQAAMAAAEAAMQAAQAAAEQAAQYAYRVYVDNTALVFEKVNMQSGEQNDETDEEVI